MLLPNKYCPREFEIGQTLNVFVYLDHEERKIATNIQPKILLHQFALLRVSAVDMLQYVFVGKRVADCLAYVPIVKGWAQPVEIETRMVRPNHLNVKLPPSGEASQNEITVI